MGICLEYIYIHADKQAVKYYVPYHYPAYVWCYFNPRIAGT